MHKNPLTEIKDELRWTITMLQNTIDLIDAKKETVLDAIVSINSQILLLEIWRREGQEKGIFPTDREIRAKQDEIEERLFAELRATKEDK